MANGRWVMLVFFMLACFSAATLGAAITSRSVDTWYAELRKPALNPPNWVFGPVWTLLYFLMSVSAWLVWEKTDWSGARHALLLFFVQLGLNVAWSALFFGLRWPGAALIEIFILLGGISATVIAFYPFSRVAFWLMLPYAGWVAFASYLNLSIWRLNRD
ncbi:MAG: tryptophan-rich sensory protein [Acidobacteriaceae bacterium]|nr:tryptophan-rich sensory protein [Acidobacteriaceae bacterium]